MRMEVLFEGLSQNDESIEERQPPHYYNKREAEKRELLTPKGNTNQSGLSAAQNFVYKFSVFPRATPHLPLEL